MEDRSSIITVITTPLGFFALSLLIVEGFLGITLGFTKVENQWFYFVGMVIGAGLFILVVGLVFYLVLKKPRNLILSGKEYLDFKKAQFESDKVIPFQKTNKSATKLIKLDNYYDNDDDEPTPEEIERAGDEWISNQIDIMRGK